MGIRFKPPSYGIEIWEGQPGAGKSFAGVDELLKKGVKERRPVYTNLPLRMKVIRKFMKCRYGDSKRSGYVIPIGFDHFYNFVVRNYDFANFRDMHEDWPVSKCDRVFQEQNGPHIYEGQGANWLYPTALIIIDEFHRWCDQRYQKDEHPGFLTYATMHRHHMHRTILLTQDQMQIPLTWRRNKAKVIRAANLMNMPFLSWMKIPFQVLRYAEYPAALGDTSDLDKMKPVRSWIRIPSWEDDGLVFRLYDSFSHVGSPRRMMKIREEVRQRIEGTSEDMAKEEKQTKQKRKRKWWKIPIFVIVIYIMYQAWGMMSTGRQEPEPVPVEQANVNLPSSNAALAVKERVVRTEDGRPVVTAVTQHFAVVDRRPIYIGEPWNEWKLENIRTVDGSTFWLRDGVDEPVVVAIGLPDGRPAAPTATGAVQTAAIQRPADRDAGTPPAERSGD